MTDHLKRAFALITATLVWAIFTGLIYGLAFFHGAAWKDQKWKDAIDQFYQKQHARPDDLESNLDI